MGHAGQPAGEECGQATRRKREENEGESEGEHVIMKPARPERGS